jgi:flavin-dependent dehydrogenase
VLVVGGGPIGLATALHAHAAGLHVEVLEPRRTPVDKACGEGLMPSAVAALAALGIDPAGVPLRGIRYLAGTRSAEAGFPNGPGRGVRRLTLQRAMSEAVEQRGIQIHRVAADRIRIDADGVTVDGRQARYLVGADGLHSTVRRAAGLHRAARSGAARYGLRRHYRLEPWSDLVEVHWARRAEAYVTPVGADEVGIAVLSTRRAPLAELLTEFPALLARIEGAEPVSQVRGAGPLRQRTSSVARGRVALVGDAAGYIDALTGEGLALGLAAAAELAACLRDDRLQDYPAAWNRVSWRSRALTNGLLAVSAVPPLRRAIVPFAVAFPAAHVAAVRLLAG